MEELPPASVVRYGDAPVVVFCDHATNTIPADLDGLRLPEDILETHIAWDIGAAAVAERIAHALQGELAVCNFSRLIVDPNRDPKSADFIPRVSDGITIPGNIGLDAAANGARKARFFDPYHETLGALFDGISTAKNPFVVSVHSFTKRMTGATAERPWPVGVLWRHDEATARDLIAWLKTRTGWEIGDNEPYDARIFNYTIDRHIAPRGWGHATLEIRQDRIGDRQGVAEMAAVLADAITAMIETSAKRKETPCDRL
ncbi:MAG: N-formylglutamate amidohydrolase [Parvularculaceae bacterium]|nr:N-formylglutamate amidohydrolase [Parvularculaceae bacterium]